MRRRLILAAIVAIAAGAAGLTIASRGGDDDSTAVGNPAGLETRTVTAGEVDIEIEPRQLDNDAAIFAIALDTHSVELSADLTQATLDVDGVTWPAEGWSGDRPGGHHRDGELRFAPAGPASGTARLTLAGFGEPVEARWELGG